MGERRTDRTSGAPTATETATAAELSALPGTAAPGTAAPGAAASEGEPANGRRPTLEDVARRAGASRSTVSRVINGDPRVRPEAAARVRSAVAELGYVPNQAARRLVTRRSSAVALVITQPQDRLFVDPYFDVHLRGVRRELARHGAQPVLLFVEEQADYPRVAEFLSGGHVDGALLFSLRADDPLPGMLERMGLPAVLSGHTVLDPADGGGRYAFVDIDNRGGARQAVRHLAGLGRRRIGTVTGPLDQIPALDRLAGYRDVLPDAPPELIAEGDYTLAGGAAATSALLDRCPDLDGLFVASDLMASGALRTLRERGRAVPDDVAVVGFDDLTPIAESTTPPLTTVHQDIEEMCRELVRLLLSRTTPDTLPSTILPTRLTLRSSA